MIRKVEAWEAEDGKVYSTELSACEASARFYLRKLECFNEASLNAVIASAPLVYEALKPLVMQVRDEPLPPAKDG